jgi:ParB-like chromosome segregation protein Spo0J
MKLPNPEEVPLKSLKAWPKNPRTHDLDSLKASLEANGQFRPILIQKSSGRIIAGHGTWQAAKALGWTDVTVQRLDVDDEAAKRILVADNRTSDHAGYNEGGLLKILESLPSLTGTGFSDESLADLSEFKTKPFITEKVAISDLKENPDNYREHLADQIDELKASIEEHGFFRSVVIAEDGTILAGHGIVQAAQALGRTRVPVIRLNIPADSTQARKVLIADNEMAHLAQVDDRKLTEMLKEILDQSSLTGTGFNGEQLAALTFATRDTGEFSSKQAIGEWVGMPEYEPPEPDFQVIVRFDTEDDREQFLKVIKNKNVVKRQNKWSIWWPDKVRRDLKALRFEQDGADA